MTSDRYQRIDESLRRRLRGMTPEALERKNLPPDQERQNLGGLIRARRGGGVSFSKIAHEVSNLAGIDVTHETIRAWWRAYESEIGVTPDGRTGTGVSR